MKKKRICRIGALLLAVVMVTSSLYVGEVYAGTGGGGGISEEQRQELMRKAYERSYFLITENDIAGFSNEVAHYTLSHPTNTLCPNNTAYFIDKLWYQGEKVSDSEFNNAVAMAANLPFDKSLNALGIEGLETLNIYWADYTSRDLTVVNSDTSIFIPGKVLVNAGYYNETDFSISGRKSDGTWDTLINTFEHRRWNSGGTTQDMTIKCSDFMKDDYVYYFMWTTQGTDAVYSGTEVGRFIVPDGNLDRFNQMCNNEYTFTPTSKQNNVVFVDESAGSAIVYDYTTGTRAGVPVSVIKEGSVFRMYDSSRGEHFYTKNENERDALIKAGWKHEANADFTVVDATDKSAIPVYRLYNPNDGGMHFYTENAAEAKNLAVSGWSYEGISHYVYNKSAEEGTPQFRLYNPNSSNGEHNWTTDVSEYNMLKNAGWADEGMCWKIK